MSNNKITIAITGSIGSGKSLAVSVVKDCGYPVCSADKVGHDALMDDQIKNRIAKNFGDDVLLDGEVSRKALGKVVFSDKDKLRLLNRIVHPHIIKTIDESIKDFKDKNIYTAANILFWEVPLLFEADLHNRFDLNINIHCPSEIRLKRIIDRDAISQEEAEQIMGRQMDDNEKVNKADINMSNICSSECFQTKIKELISLLDHYC